MLGEILEIHVCGDSELKPCSIPACFQLKVCLVDSSKRACKPIPAHYPKLNCPRYRIPCPGCFVTCLDEGARVSRIRRFEPSYILLDRLNLSTCRSFRVRLNAMLTRERCSTATTSYVVGTGRQGYRLEPNLRPWVSSSWRMSLADFANYRHGFEVRRVSLVA